MTVDTTARYILGTLYALLAIISTGGAWYMLATAVRGGK